jgi:hypothetical protein
MSKTYESAARALGMKTREVVAVDGDLVTTFDGVVYRLGGDEPVLVSSRGQAIADAAPAKTSVQDPAPAPVVPAPAELSNEELLQLVADRGLTLPAEAGNVPTVVAPPEPPSENPDAVPAGADSAAPAGAPEPPAKGRRGKPAGGDAS